jgi:3-oxoacyl-[acyl-carrier-protein] synthase-3
MLFAPSKFICTKNLSMYQSKIIGLGHYVPDQVITNDDLTKMMDTSDEWITERTGIKERRFFVEGKDTTSTMGAEAAKMALKQAGLEASQMELVIFSTLSPDYFFPGAGVLALRHLGISGMAALDLRAQCAGFIFALSVADQFIKTGMYKNVLIICSEIQSTIMEQSTRGRNMAVIFGDGAGAAVVTAHSEPGKGVLSTHMHGDGNFAEDLYMPHPGAVKKARLTHEMLDDGSMLPHMSGNLVFKHAIVRFEEAINEALAANNYTINDVDLLIPHQANLRISSYIQNKFGLPDSKVYNNIQRFGNTTAASIPLAMSEAFETGAFKEGDLICLAAFGSGFLWGSSLIRF